MTPAEELAAAADRLDVLAAAATDGPWMNDTRYVWIADALDFGHVLDDNGAYVTDLRYIAAMDPLVGPSAVRAIAGTVVSCCGPRRPLTNGAQDRAPDQWRCLMSIPCNYPRTGLVTSHRKRGMFETVELGPHAETPVCNLQECIDEATKWVQRMSHKPAFHVLDKGKP